MVRIVGILCGSALAISFLILALGVPELLPQTTVHAEPAVAALDHSEPEPAPAEDLLIEAALDEPLETAIELVKEEVPPEPVIDDLLAAESVAQPSTEHWYAFWSPFRSELAANGFVSQLQKTTGMDYRVVRLKPGVYEVAFAYEAETDIQTSLAAISAATGLEMPDG
ncbi:MAG: hypothetical protein GWP67_00470 [Gammaproteobacteria bacterium]|jgi:hypothetical protein|nr:hypothetical protein [Gammaproteobacteria bacterium]